MAAEIEGLKARVADLERENEELKRNTKPRYNSEHTSPHPAPGFPSATSIATTIRAQQHRAASWEQRIIHLQLENANLRQQTAELRDNNQTLRQRVEDQDSILSMTDVRPIYPLSIYEGYTNRAL
jgi:DNA repair exonuclease SbcCD ATPase subunit